MVEDNVKVMILGNWNNHGAFSRNKEVWKKNLFWGKDIHLCFIRHLI